MLGMQLGEQIRQCRLKAGLTQEGLARALNVSNRLVSHWEIGFRKPRPAHLRQIAELTFADPALFFSGEFGVEYELPVTSPEEVALLKLYRRISQRQQQNLLKLLQASVDVRKEMEHDPHPMPA